MGRREGKDDVPNDTGQATGHNGARPAGFARPTLAGGTPHITRSAQPRRCARPARSTRSPPPGVEPSRERPSGIGLGGLGQSYPPAAPTSGGSETSAEDVGGTCVT